MTATGPKQAQIQTILAALKKTYPADESADKLTIIEELLYSLCRSGAGRDAADKAFRQLRERFFDWNEVRVSTAEEIAEALAELPEPMPRARKIIGVLQEWFELTYSFDMEEVAQKGLKEGVKKLSRLPNIDDFSTAWVAMRGMGGHAIPLDQPALIALRRLGVIEGDETDIEAVRGGVEHVVPKAKGPLFVELVNRLAFDTCRPEGPQCPRCVLKPDCPTGKAYAGDGGASKKPR